MTAFTTLLDGTSSKASGGGTVAGVPGFAVFEGFYDATTRSVGTSDTIALVDLPAGCTILAAHIEVMTADAGGGTIGLTNGTQIATGEAVSSTGVFDCAVSAFFTAAASTVLLNCATAAMTTLKVRAKIFCCVS